MATETKKSYFETVKDDMEGFGSINDQTLAIPFIKLAQDLTPQTKEIKADVYIKGLKPGLFFNAATNDILGGDFQFIVGKFERIYIEWEPDRGGLVNYHSPENAERLTIDTTFGKWRTKEGNLLREYYTYYGLIVGKEHEGIVIYSLTSSGIKVAKLLNRLITTQNLPNGERARPYYLILNVSSVHVEKGENDWFMPKFGIAGFVSEEQYKIVKEERKALPEKTVDYALIEDKSEAAGDTEEF